MRFRIIEMLIVVAVIALSIVSLHRATPQLESVYYTFTLLAILFGFLMGIARSGVKRSFWLAFGIASGAYLGFAHLPDEYGSSPRQHGRELTTQLLWLTYNWTRDVWGQETIFTPEPGGLFSIQDEIDSTRDDDNPFSQFPASGLSTNSPTYSINYGGGQRIISLDDLPAFIRIGHCVWALIIGYVSAHFVQVLVTTKLNATSSA